MKDTTKQPGIIAENIIVAQSDFSRVMQFVEPLSYNCEFKYESNVSPENTSGQGRLQATVTVKDNDNNEVFQINCTVVGIYSADSDSNMGLTEFLTNAAPAHLVAFVREHVANMSVKAGIPPLVLPPYNIQAMLSTKKNETENK